MKRNVWKRSHDEKCNNVLGMKYQTARSQLERNIILYLAEKANMNNCFQCGFPIESSDDLSVEHKISWAGNEAKGIESNKDLFWDLNNIGFSHKWCNCAAGSGGSGSSSYVGVHRFIDNRKTPAYNYFRAMICIDCKDKVMGHYHTQEEAAIAYDLAVMIFRKGIGKLNYNQFREIYSVKLNEEKDNPKLLDIRNGPIKPIVACLYNLLKSNPTVI